MWGLRVGLFALAALGCAASDTREERPDLAERPDEPGSTRASREARAEAAGGEERRDPVVPAASDRPLFVAHPIAALRGEDGRGGVIAATRPIALDVDGRRVPARALDPVLSVGPLRFTRYEHPAPGLLRFVVADVALLPRGAEVSVQYGDDPGSRLVLAPSLEISP